MNLVVAKHSLVNKKCLPPEEKFCCSFLKVLNMFIDKSVVCSAVLLFFWNDTGGRRSL